MKKLIAIILLLALLAVLPACQSDRSPASTPADTSNGAGNSANGVIGDSQMTNRGTNFDTLKDFQIYVQTLDIAFLEREQKANYRSPFLDRSEFVDLIRDFQQNKSITVPYLNGKPATVKNGIHIEENYVLTNLPQFWFCEEDAYILVTYLPEGYQRQPLRDRGFGTVITEMQLADRTVEVLFDMTKYGIDTKGIVHFSFYYDDLFVEITGKATPEWLRTLQFGEIPIASFREALPATDITNVSVYQGMSYDRLVEQLGNETAVYSDGHNFPYTLEWVGDNGQSFFTYVTYHNGSWVTTDSHLDRTRYDKPIKQLKLDDFWVFTDGYYLHLTEHLGAPDREEISDESNTVEWDLDDGRTLRVTFTDGNNRDLWMITDFTCE